MARVTETGSETATGMGSETATGMASAWLPEKGSAEIELVRIWCTSVSGADDPQPATSGATTNNPPKTTKIGVRRNTKILLRLGRSETL
jgi:hypothetical protein